MHILTLGLLGLLRAAVGIPPALSTGEESSKCGEEQGQREVLQQGVKAPPHPAPSCPPPVPIDYDRSQREGCMIGNPRLFPVKESRDSIRSGSGGGQEIDVKAATPVRKQRIHRGRSRGIFANQILLVKREPRSRKRKVQPGKRKTGIVQNCNLQGIGGNIVKPISFQRCLQPQWGRLDGQRAYQRLARVHVLGSGEIPENEKANCHDDQNCQTDQEP